MSKFKINKQAPANVRPVSKAKQKARAAEMRLRRRERDMERAMFSLDINTGVEKLRPEDLLQREMPGRVQDSFVRARAWHTENWFVEMVCRLKADFYNYGLEIVPKRKGAKVKLDSFLENLQSRKLLLRFIRSVWSEWVMLDTVVSFWRKDAKQPPFLLKPERCEYTDRFGIEKLKVNLGYRKHELEGEGKNGEQVLGPNEIRRYSSGNQITLSEENDEYFEVLTRGLEGEGFAWPRMRTVFRTLSQNESMEVGESMLAFGGRLVVRRHKIGFEVRSGANALRQEAYLWKKDRANAIQRFYQGRAGFAEEVAQFDHSTEYSWVDPKFYEAKKWESIVQRMLWWGGPVAYISFLKQPNPNLFQAFQVEAEAEREIVRDYLEAVIAEGFGLDVKLNWSTRCFQDVRLGWQMVQFLTQQGPLSLTTALEEAQFDPEKEMERKKKEKPQKENLMPLWDPSHGKRPGAQDNAGRPAGKPNGEPS